jgi:hypothetical protein
MPRYFFHFHDGQTPPDKEGTEFPNLQAARAEAVRLAGEALKWHAETFWNEGEWSLEVTDPTGLTLFTLYFTAVEAAVIRRREGRPGG